MTIIKIAAFLILNSIYFQLCYSQITSSTHLIPEDFNLNSLSTSSMGHSLNNCGDLNNDGFDDIVFTVSGSFYVNNVLIKSAEGFWIALLGENAELIDYHHIGNELKTYFPDSLELNYFQIDAIGDVDNNGMTDFMIGYWNYNSGDSYSHLGIAKLDTDLSLLDVDIIPTSEFIIDDNNFGIGLENIGDLDSNGYDEVCLSLSDPSQLLILFMGEDGLILDQVVIDNNFVSTNELFWRFAMSVSGNHDLNLDGYIDIVIGSPHANETGVITILYLDDKANVLNYKNIEKSDFHDALDYFEDEDPHIGEQIELIPDLNNDGIPEILVADLWTDINIIHQGLMVIVSVDIQGNVLGYAPVFDPHENYLELREENHLGHYTAILNDLNNDGYPEIACNGFAYFTSRERSEPGHIKILSSDFSFFTNGFISNIPETLKENEILVFPNPASYEITVYSTSQTQWDQIQLINLGGELVFELTERSSLSVIPIDKLSAGIYILKVRSENSDYIKRVVIEN